MEDNMHPVVSLLITRMASHPEEFESFYDGRWHGFFARVKEHASEEERATLTEAYDRIQLDRLHRDVMDELLNGEERRAKEAERLLNKRSAMAVNSMASPYAQQAQSYAQMAQAGLYASTPSLPVLGGGTGATTLGGATATSLQLGAERLDENILSTMKRKLGL